jgi:hypothetical protein
VQCKKKPASHTGKPAPAAAQAEQPPRHGSSTPGVTPHRVPCRLKRPADKLYDVQHCEKPHTADQQQSQLLYGVSEQPSPPFPTEGCQCSTWAVLLTTPHRGCSMSGSVSHSQSNACQPTPAQHRPAARAHTTTGIAITGLSQLVHADGAHASTQWHGIAAAATSKCPWPWSTT